MAKIGLLRDIYAHFQGFKAALKAGFRVDLRSA
jgi:hypothetical protein